jgi:hypothetical protein
MALVQILALSEQHYYVFGVCASIHHFSIVITGLGHVDQSHYNIVKAIMVQLF